MKLTKLHIYGFGRFQDYQIKLSEEPIHIFLGENEAGKSTIMAFIRCILFGFPTKQQSELRYEPRLGGRYGGSIVIETKHYGEVTVERVAGKATGDVKIYFNDGSIGGEEELKLVLGEIDRTIFTGIYSFGMTDLQTMEQLNSEELNRFMYGVGISGRQSLLEVEKRTEKEIQSLYKPTGRKPMINQRLKKIADLDDKVRDWRSKLSGHNQLVKEREGLIDKIQKLTSKKQRLNQTFRYYEKLQSIAPVILRKVMYENRLQQLPSYEPFPEDGVERFEKLHDHLVIVDADVMDLEQKLKQNSVEIENLETDECLAELEEAIAKVRETAKVYENKREEKVLLQQKIQYEQEEYGLLKDKIGIDRFDPASFVTSFLAEQQLEKLIEEDASCKQQGGILQSQFQQAKASLEEKEGQVEKIKAGLLDVKKRQELQNELSNEKTEFELTQQLKLIDEKIEQITSQIKRLTPVKNQWKDYIFPLSSAVIFIVAVFLFISSQVYLGIALSVIGLTLIAALKLQKDSPTIAILDDLIVEKEAETLRRQSIIEELQHLTTSEYDQLREIIKRDDQLQDELFLRELSLKEVQKSYEALCTKIDQWEIVSGKLKENLVAWAATYRYPQHLSATHYLKMFKLVEQLKHKQRELDYLINKRAMLDNEMNDMEVEVKTLCHRFSLQYDVKNHFQHIEKLSQLLKGKQEKEKLYHRLTHRQDELRELLKASQTKRTQYRNEIQKLFRLANLTSEESFRQKGKAWNESQEIKEQLRVLKSQIVPLVKNEDELIALERDAIIFSDGLDEKIMQLEHQISSFGGQEKQLHERLAEVKLEIKELEEGSSYSTSLHNLENEKGILKGEVRKWAFHRTVQLLIDEAKSVYEKERQPKVIQEATKLFSHMTKGVYSQIFAPIGERRLLAERNDGLKFEPNELSQGTREQLYLALRWALATVHSKQSALPIFVDDIFVNFDRERRLQAISLLNEMSKKHQIIFFTCHPFIASEISSNYYSL